MGAYAVAATPRVDVNLVPERDAVRQGEPVLVGLKFKIEPGWHIYWKYPGDAGLPTSVKWSLPEGFKVSETLWPVPKRFVQPGDIEGFGYEGEVMLLASVTPPAGYVGEAAIRGRVSWLVCKDVCVPGRADVVTTVRFGNEQGTPDADIVRWRARVPKDAKQGGVQRDGFIYSVRVPAEMSPESVEVFVAPAEGLSLKRIERSEQGVKITMSRIGNLPVRGETEAVIAEGDSILRFLLPSK